MINEDQKLNKNIFDLSVEQIPIRNGFGEGLVFAGEENENVVALCADLTESTRMKAFRDKFSNRFVQIGVAEQNLASVASGMAAMGKIPFISSYAMFSPGRNWEQIRTTICYNNTNVKIAGSHAGVSVGPDGGTHQAVEDIAITRVIPRMVVIAPCDAIEAKKATVASAKTIDPTYLRLAREKTPIITTADSPFKIGKANPLVTPEHPEVSIIACGALVHTALLAAKKLKDEGIEVSVVNLHTIKPIDEEAVVSFASQAGAVVTVEEHQKAGGMGSAVAEVLSRRKPVPIEFIGVSDDFGQSGTPSELLEHYGMDVKDITEAVKKVKERKNK